MATPDAAASAAPAPSDDDLLTVYDALAADAGQSGTGRGTWVALVERATLTDRFTSAAGQLDTARIEAAGQALADGGYVQLRPRAWKTLVHRPGAPLPPPEAGGDRRRRRTTVTRTTAGRRKAAAPAGARKRAVKRAGRAPAPAEEPQRLHGPLASALAGFVADLRSEVGRIEELTDQIDDHVRALNDLRAEQAQRLAALEELRGRAESATLGSFLAEATELRLPSVVEELPEGPAPAPARGRRRRR